MLIIFGGILGIDGKMIMKNLKRGREEHYTLRLSHKDFSFDLYKTKEGKAGEKSHKTLALGKRALVKYTKKTIVMTQTVCHVWVIYKIAEKLVICLPLLVTVISLMTMMTLSIYI